MTDKLPYPDTSKYLGTSKLQEVFDGLYPGYAVRRNTTDVWNASRMMDSDPDPAIWINSHEIQGQVSQKILLVQFGCAHKIKPTGSLFSFDDIHTCDRCNEMLIEMTREAMRIGSIHEARRIRKNIQYAMRLIFDYGDERLMWLPNGLPLVL